jgi:hypothetical protein
VAPLVSMFEIRHRCVYRPGAAVFGARPSQRRARLSSVSHGSSHGAGKPLSTLPTALPDLVLAVANDPVHAKHRETADGIQKPYRPGG